MSISTKLRRVPGRLTTGAFILNSGLGKLKGDEATAKAIHGMAAGAYPALGKVPPKVFLKGVAVGEVALGSALLLPIVPAGLAGLGLTGFSAGLLGMWWRLPGMHEPKSLKPTQQGTAIAKDVFMLGIGAGLVIDAALSEGKVSSVDARAHARATLKAEAKQAKKSAKKAARRARQQASAILPG
jgi:uncharacterized membrane protein YphA (DoxX/SURF4 family)